MDKSGMARPPCLSWLFSKASSIRWLATCRVYTSMFAAGSANLILWTSICIHLPVCRTTFTLKKSPSKHHTCFTAASRWFRQSRPAARQMLPISIRPSATSSQGFPSAQPIIPSSESTDSQDGLATKKFPGTSVEKAIQRSQACPDLSSFGSMGIPSLQGA